MRRSARRTILVLSLVAAALGATPLAAHGQTPAVNKIVVYATFANGSPPPGASITVHVGCANEGGSPVVDVVDETKTVSAPFDPITFDIPVLETGGPNTFVGCEVYETTSTDLFGLVYYSCGVADPGTPPPDPSPPSGCGSQRVRVDAFFPVTVSGAVYNVIIQTLLATHDQPTPAPAPAPAPAPEIVSAPTFTG